MVLNTLNISALRGEPQFDVVTANSERFSSVMMPSMDSRKKPDSSIQFLKISGGRNFLHSFIRPNA